MPAKMKSVKKKVKAKPKPKAKPATKKKVMKSLSRGRVKVRVGKGNIPASMLNDLVAKKKLKIKDAKGKAVGELILADPNVVIRKEGGKIKGFYSAKTGRPVSPLWAQKLALKR